MKRLILFLTAFILTTALFSNLLYAQDEIRIWKEFVVSLKRGEITPDKIRPYAEFVKPTIMEMMKKMREMAVWKEWAAAPEIYPVGNKVHFLIPLTYYGNKATYCFTFVVEGKDWYFVQPETILVRMDKISSLPTSIFPDTTEDQKAWMREEIRISELVVLFNFLAKEKGKDFAFNWFRDGYGYFIAAQAQVPFVPERKAFILYLCWEQANLRGQKVTLEKLEDNEAIVRIQPFYLLLYEAAAHIKPQISFEDYRKIFETIWQDRAEKAGWNLQISYEQEWCLLHFKKAQ
jgi:hypothetical protein